MSEPTGIVLNTPARRNPDTPVTITGTYSGDPTSLNLQYDTGSGWIQASSVQFADNHFQFTLAGGLLGGTYLGLAVRDSDAPSVAASIGGYAVSSWTPQTLATSPGAHAIFEFNPNDPNVTVKTGIAVIRVLNSLNPSQSLTVRTGSDGNLVAIADHSGAAGTSRVLKFSPSHISPDQYDPATNWLSAGGVDGTGGAELVDLANSANLSSGGSFTTIIALDISTSYTYAAGPIWGSLASPGPLHYAQLRSNTASGVQGADITDDDGAAANASGSVSAGWHVMTMIKNGGVLSYRLDGRLVSSSVIASTSSFTASDFMIGGGLPPASSSSAGAENGVPPSFVGEFQAYGGVLAGTDLTNAESLAASSIGVSLPLVDASSHDIWLADAPARYAAGAGSIVHVGAAPATVSAAAGSVLVEAGGGSLWFLGGGSPSTVSGGAGAVFVIGGSGGGHYSAGSGGASVLVAGGGNTSLTGGGNGDRLFGSNSGAVAMSASGQGESLVGGAASTTISGSNAGSTVIFAGGNTTVDGGAAGGDTIVGGAGALSVAARNGDAVFGGSGSLAVVGSAAGADTVVGAGGTMSVAGQGANMLVVAARSASNITMGSGAGLVFSGSGTTTVNGGAGSLQVMLGAASTTVSEGSGAVVYDLVAGSAGGAALLQGFRPATDRIALFGYHASDLSVTTTSGSAVLTLTDGTRITLAGVTDPGDSILL